LPPGPSASLFCDQLLLIDIVSPPDQWAGLGDAYQVDAKIAVFVQDDATMIPAGALFVAVGAGMSSWSRTGAQDPEKFRSSGGQGVPQQYPKVQRSSHRLSEQPYRSVCI